MLVDASKAVKRAAASLIFLWRGIGGGDLLAFVSTRRLLIPASAQIEGVACNPFVLTSIALGAMIPVPPLIKDGLIEVLRDVLLFERRSGMAGGGIVGLELIELILESIKFLIERN